jgi:cytochrome P450
MDQNIDLTDIRLYLDRKEHSVFEQLRRHTPVSFQPEPDGPGYFAVMAHAEVRRVLMNAKTFINGEGTALADEPHRKGQERSMHTSDMPRHGQLRAVVADSFRKEAIARHAPMVRAVVTDILDTLPRGEKFDFVDRVARRIPMIVLAKVLGVPDDMREQIVAWGDLFSDTTADVTERRNAFVEIARYLPALIARKAADPQDDLMSVLVKARIDGEPLSLTQIQNLFGLLITAGNETTRFLLAGAMEKLALSPELANELYANPGLIPDAVDEFVRWIAPVRHMRRTAAENTEIGGVPVKAGDKVVVFFASAARDEAVFDHPDDVRFDRKPNNHLGFGVGPHFCVGMHLAKLEAVVFFEEWFSRFRRLSINGLGERLPSYWFNGLARLDVTVE